MVLVHGWSCDRSLLAPQFEYFATSSAVASLDLRGHGDSGRPEPTAGTYDVEVLADDVLAVAVAAGFDRPVVVGHSLGGLAALALAARPGAVRAAVLVDPAPITSERLKANLGAAAVSVADDHDASWRADFIAGMFLPGNDDRRAGILDVMTRVPPGIAAACLRAMATFDGVSALRAVQVPLLSIGAARPLNHAAELLAACPGITIGQTVGAGHFNQLEAAGQVNLMIERFLAVNGLTQPAASGE